MHFATTHPDQTDRLIVVDIAPRAYGNRHDDIFDALCSLDLTRHSQRKEVEEALSLHIKEPATLQFLLKNLGRNEDGKFTWKMNLPVLRKHYHEISTGLRASARFEKPVLFVKGGRSSYIASEDKPHIKHIFPRSNIITIKNAGHWVHADAPEELEKIILKFLEPKRIA
jgi:esterase